MHLRPSIRTHLVALPPAAAVRQAVLPWYMPVFYQSARGATTCFEAMRLEVCTLRSAPHMTAQRILRM